MSEGPYTSFEPLVIDRRMRIFSRVYIAVVLVGLIALPILAAKAAVVNHWPLAHSVTLPLLVALVWFLFAALVFEPIRRSFLR